MNKQGIRYFLGIDGGGTKTEFLLKDSTGTELHRLLLGASNPVNNGIENTLSILKSGINEICKDIPYNEISVFAGIAGSKSSVISDKINDFLLSFGFGKAANGSDIENAIHTALKKGNGIAVITGTGVIAYGRYNKEVFRCGGWGYMIDKGGSAYCYGADALNSALSFIDGRDGSECINNLLEIRLSQPVADAVPQIYKNGPVYVASLAPVVFEAYKMNDKKAAEIIDKNCRELAAIISACGKNIKEEKINTVLLGGLCKQKDITEGFLKKYLDKKYILSFSEEPMVNGAILSAQNI